jgi:hypothetical protein
MISTALTGAAATVAILRIKADANGLNSMSSLHKLFV